MAHLAVARASLPPSLQGFHGLLGRDVLFRWEAVCLHGRRRLLTVRDTPTWLARWLG